MIHNCLCGDGDRISKYGVILWKQRLVHTYTVYDHLAPPSESYQDFEWSHISHLLDNPQRRFLVNGHMGSQALRLIRERMRGWAIASLTLWFTIFICRRNNENTSFRASVQPTALLHVIQKASSGASTIMLPPSYGLQKAAYMKSQIARHLLSSIRPTGKSKGKKYLLQHLWQPHAQWLVNPSLNLAHLDSHKTGGGCCKCQYS